MFLLFSSGHVSAFVLGNNGQFSIGCSASYTTAIVNVSWSTTNNGGTVWNAGGTSNWSVGSPYLGAMSMFIQLSHGGVVGALTLNSISAQATSLGSYYVGTAANTCYTPVIGGTHQVTLNYGSPVVQFWDPVWAACFGLGSYSSASTSVNISADVFDVSTGTFVAGPTHTSLSLASQSVSCSGSGTWYNVSGPVPFPGPFNPMVTFPVTFVAGDSYLFWVGSYVSTQVYASTPGHANPATHNATADANVNNLQGSTAPMGTITCSGC
jgi:hypothetical protein